MLSARATVVLLAIAALTLLVSAPAGAAVRYAAPSAGGTDPCNPAPCSLGKAVSGAKAGDQVVLAAGTYKSASGVVVDKAIDVGGAPGAVTSIEFSGDSGASVEHPAATLHDVRLFFSGSTMAYKLTLESGTVERVYAGGSFGGGCTMSAGLLRDSACFEGLFASPSGAGTYNGTIVNVTANPLMVGAHDGAKFNVTVANSIALSNAGGPGDLEINAGPTGSVSVTSVNSSFVAVDTSLSAGTGFTYTPAGTNGNQTAPPHLVDPVDGDFRPLASSPTVDAGTTLTQLGSLDLAGGPRRQPACIGGPPVPDIGAYEFVPTVDCPGMAPAPAPSSGPTPVSAIRFGKLTRDVAKGTATLPVVLPVGGTVVMKGEGLVRRKVALSRAATLKLIVKAKGSKLEKLRESGKVGVRPSLVFTPLVGAPQAVVKPLTLKLAADQRAQ